MYCKIDTKNNIMARLGALISLYRYITKIPNREYSRTCNHKLINTKSNHIEMTVYAVEAAFHSGIGYRIKVGIYIHYKILLRDADDFEFDYIHEDQSIRIIRYRHYMLTMFINVKQYTVFNLPDDPELNEHCKHMDSKQMIIMAFDKLHKYIKISRNSNMDLQ